MSKLGLKTFGSCVGVSAMTMISKADALICEIVFTLHQWKKKHFII